MLRPAAFQRGAIESLHASIAHGPVMKSIVACMKPLIDYESECIKETNNGNPEALVNLLESSPLASNELSAYEAHTSRLREVQCEAISRLEIAGLGQSAQTIVSRHFGGVYFSFQQAAVLDAILSVAESADGAIRDTLKAAALSTASTLVNSIGKQFAQPVRPRNKDGTIKANLAKLVQRDRSEDALAIYSNWLAKYAALPQARYETSALREDYLDALTRHGSTFSVIYADPPYTRDHYSRFYHVLETMCLRDNPKVSRVVKRGKVELSRGMYREDRHQSPFCIRSAAPRAFAALFETARQYALPLVLSYSPHEAGDGTHPRVVSTSQIVEIAHTYYPRVEISQIEGAVHNQLNRSDLKLRTRDHAELLLKCFR
jgi:hypothetical protein